MLPRGRETRRRSAARVARCREDRVPVSAIGKPLRSEPKLFWPPTEVLHPPLRRIVAAPGPMKPLQLLEPLADPMAEFEVCPQSEPQRRQPDFVGGRQYVHLKTPLRLGYQRHSRRLINRFSESSRPVAIRQDIPAEFEVRMHAPAICLHPTRLNPGRGSGCYRFQHRFAV